MSQLSGYPSSCGWFCRRLHDLKDVVDVVAPRVGQGISKVLLMFNIDADNFAFRNSELSVQDQYILDNWYKQNFEPFTINILNLFKGIETAKTSVEKVNIINEVRSQLCLVSSYYQLLVIPIFTEIGVSGMTVSQQGINEMNSLIFEFSNALLEEVAIELSKFKTIEEDQKLQFKTLLPIVPILPKGVTEYICKQYILTRIENTNEVTNPVDNTDVIDDTQNTPTTSTPKQKKSGLGLFAGLLFGTAVLIVATSNNDDKKKKNQK